MPSDVAVSDYDHADLEIKCDAPQLRAPQIRRHERDSPNRGITFCHNGHEARFSSLAEAGAFLMRHRFLDRSLI